MLPGRPENGFTRFPIFPLLINLGIGKNSFSVSLQGDVQLHASVGRHHFLFSVPQFLSSSFPACPRVLFMVFVPYLSALEEGNPGFDFYRSEEASSIRQKGEIPCGKRGKSIQEMNNFVAAVPPPAWE